MKNTISYQEGIKAAKNGGSINNSGPFDRDEFIEGFKSIKPLAKEDTYLSNIGSKKSRMNRMSLK